MAEQSGDNISGSVAGLLLFQAPWLAMAIFVWNLPFFYSSMLYDSVWYGMLFILLSFCAMLPTLIALGIKMGSGPNVSNRYKEQLWAGIFCLPVGLEWAYLWMAALPFAWTLLPWGDFAYNWWKIFPYFGLFGMSMWGLAPLAMIFGPDPEPMHELGTRYLQKGMKGSDVREVQQLLNEHGISCGVDGNFGPQTEEAVKQFQSREGFGLKVDGVVGKKTRVALQEEPEKPEGDQMAESKPEVQMKDAIIHDNHLHGTVTGHPKLGDSEIKTSSIINQDKEGEIHRIETENTIYLIHKNDWSDNLSEEEEAPVEEVVPVEEAPVKKAPVEVKAEQQEAELIQTRTLDLKGVAQELQNVTFSSDREKIIKGATDQSQSVDLIIEKVDRTAAGFRLSEELKGGMTVFGRTAEGAEIEMRMPSSMNDEIKRLGKSDTLTCKASVAGWNTIRKLLQMDWLE